MGRVQQYSPGGSICSLRQLHRHPGHGQQSLVDTHSNIHGVVTYLDDLDPQYGSFELYSGKIQGLHSWDGYFRIRVRSSGVVWQTQKRRSNF